MKTMQILKFVRFVVPFGAIAIATFSSPYARAALHSNEVAEIAPHAIAQSFCPDRAGGGQVVAFYETDDFWIYICPSDLPGQFLYHGISKEDTENYINLYAEWSDGGFTAYNGDYTYRITEDILLVFEGDSVIVNQAVY